MEFDSRGDKQLVKSGGFLKTASSDFVERGQSTIEYAVIMAAFAVILAGLAALLHAMQSGIFIEHALSVASHHVGSVVPAVVADIFLY